LGCFIGGKDRFINDKKHLFSGFDESETIKKIKRQYYINQLIRLSEKGEGI
jgi:cytochrome b involved in lipid metabolism